MKEGHHRWDKLPKWLKKPELQTQRVWRCRRCWCIRYTKHYGYGTYPTNYIVTSFGWTYRYERLPKCEPIDTPIGA